MRLSDLDAATRDLYDRIVAAPENRRLIEAIESSEAEQNHSPDFKPRLVLVPGIFYRDYPHTGADGAILREVADALGLEFSTVPVDGTEGLDANASSINQWLDRADDKAMLLFSLSKGSAEIRHALTKAESMRAFRNVIGWVSVSGLPFGTPSFEAYLENPLRSAFIRTIFWIKHWRLDPIRDLLRYRPDAPCEVPATLPVVQVVAFPEQSDLRDRRSRWLRRKLAPLGPNDGFAVIGDLERLPGRVFPIRGTDHYLHRISNLQSKIKRLVEVLIEESNSV